MVSELEASVSGDSGPSSVAGPSHSHPGGPHRFPLAAQPEIMRAAEKDDQYASFVYDACRDAFRHLFGLLRRLLNLYLLCFISNLIVMLSQLLFFEFGISGFNFLFIRLGYTCFSLLYFLIVLLECFDDNSSSCCRDNSAVICN